MFKAGGRVLIVGGGYIGLEAAAVASTLGLRVTLVEATSRILQRVAAPQTSDYFRALHAGRGVEVLEATGLLGMEALPGGTIAAHLGDGRDLAVDFVIVGIGVNLAAAPQVDGRETIALAALGPAPSRDSFANALAQSFDRELERWRTVGIEPLLRRDLETLAAAAKFYKQRLKDTPRAIEYLKGRGVSGETAARFGIGYAPDGWRSLDDFRGLRRERVVLQSAIRRPEASEYEGGYEHVEGYAPPEPVGHAARATVSS